MSSPLLRQLKDPRVTLTPSHASTAAGRQGTLSALDGKTSDLARKLRRVSAWQYRYVNQHHTNGKANHHSHDSALSGPHASAHHELPNDTVTDEQGHRHLFSPASGPSSSCSSRSRNDGGGSVGDDRPGKSLGHAHHTRARASTESSTHGGASQHHTANVSTLPPPLTSLTGGMHHSATESDPMPVPHSFVEILLHEDFTAELRRRSYLVMEYVRGRLPLLLELVMGHFDVALAMEVVTAATAVPSGGTAYTGSRSSTDPALLVAPETTTTASTTSLTAEQCAALTQVALRVLSGRTDEARDGALDAYHATCGPVWDAITAHAFFQTHLSYVKTVATALQEACNEVEAIVPFAMSLLTTQGAVSTAAAAVMCGGSQPQSLSFSGRAPEWLSRQISAACSVSSSLFVADMAVRAVNPPESPAALTAYILSRCKYVQHLLTILEALLVAMSMIDTHSADRVADGAGTSPGIDRRPGGGGHHYLHSGSSRSHCGARVPDQIRTTWSDDGLLDVDAHTIAQLSPTSTGLQHGQAAQQDSDDDKERHTFSLPHSSASSFIAEDQCDDDAPNRMLAHVTVTVTAAFTHAFLSTTTVQRQLVEYSDYHARYHGLCVTGAHASPETATSAGGSAVPLHLSGPNLAVSERNLPSVDPRGPELTSPGSPAVPCGMEIHGTPHDGQGRMGQAQPHSAHHSGCDLVLMSPSLRSARAAPLLAAEATGEEVMLALVLEKASTLAHGSTGTPSLTLAASPLSDDRSFGSDPTHSGPSQDGVTSPPVLSPLAAQAKAANESAAVAGATASSLLLPPLPPSGAARGATTSVATTSGTPQPCLHCERFRAVEMELTEQVRENMSVLCLTTIACVAHDVRIAESAIAYMDEQGPVFAAQATMLLAHVLTPELMAVHPPDSRGGKALEWMLRFVFGGCSGADVARARLARRLRLEQNRGRRSDPFSLANSERSSADATTPRSGSDDGGDLSSPAAGGAEGRAQEARGSCFSADTFSDSAVALRVEYVLAASFIRCHPLMTVMGVVAETNAYNCGATISKAVMQYACTLSQTSVTLLRGPLPSARWSTPFTEAMMKGLSDLALHQRETTVLAYSADVTPTPQYPMREPATGQRPPVPPFDARLRRTGARGTRDGANASNDTSEDHDAGGEVSDVSCRSGSFSTCRSDTDVSSDADSDEQANGLRAAPVAADRLQANAKADPSSPCIRSPRHLSHRQRRDRQRRRHDQHHKEAAPFSFMPGPRATVTGTSPQDEAEPSGARTRRRCHALHWAKCVLLSARTLSKAHTPTVAVPRDHFLYMHELSKRLQRLLHQSNRAIIAAAEKHAARKTSTAGGGPGTRQPADGAPAVPTAGSAEPVGATPPASPRGPASSATTSGVTVTHLPSSVLMHALVDVLQSAQSLPAHTRLFARSAAAAAGTGVASGMRSLPGVSARSAKACGAVEGEDSNNENDDETECNASHGDRLPARPYRSTVPSSASSIAPRFLLSEVQSSGPPSLVTCGRALHDAEQVAKVMMRVTDGQEGSRQELDNDADTEATNNANRDVHGGGGLLHPLSSVPPTIGTEASTATGGVHTGGGLPHEVHLAVSERHEQAFADSFCFGKSDLGDLLDNAPAFVSVPLHEVVYASLFSILEAIGDVLLCERPRLNSIFVNDVLTLLYEIRLCMMESAASEDLFGITSALSMNRSSVMAATGSVSQNGSDLSGSAPYPFGSTRPTLGGAGSGAAQSLSTASARLPPITALSRVTAEKPAVLFPEFYVVLLESGLRINEVVRRWRRELKTDPNHPAAGLLPLLQRVKGRAERLQMPSEEEQRATRGALRLLLGVSTQGHLRSLHGTVLHVDDLDVKGTRKEEMTPRLGMSASLDTLRSSRTRASECANVDALQSHISVDRQDEAVGSGAADECGGRGKTAAAVGCAEAMPDAVGRACVLPRVATAELDALAELTTTIADGPSVSPPSAVFASPTLPLLPTGRTLAPSSLSSPSSAPAPSPAAATVTEQRSARGDAPAPCVKHSVRLVGTPADLLAVQQRAEGHLGYNLPTLRRSLLEALTSEPSAVHTATPESSPVSTTTTSASAARHAHHTPADALFCAQINFQREATRWRAVEPDWIVTPVTGSGVVTRNAAAVGKEGEDNEADVEAGRSGGSPARSTRVQPLRTAQPHSATSRTSLSCHHTASQQEERPSAMLLPNTLRLLESGAFGAAGGNWSFSFMRKSDAAQWVMLDRHSMGTDANDDADETSGVKRASEEHVGEVARAGALAGVAKSHHAAAALSALKVSALSQLSVPDTTPVSVSSPTSSLSAATPDKSPHSPPHRRFHTRSNSTMDCRCRRHEAEEEAHLVQHSRRSHAVYACGQTVPALPRRRARSQPCPTFYHSRDGLFMAETDVIAPHRTVSYEDPPTVGRNDDVIEETAPQGTPTSSPLLCDESSPPSLGVPLSSDRTSVPAKPGSTTRGISSVDMRARSPLLSMAAVRKHSVADFLRMLSAEDGEGGTSPGRARRSTVKKPALLSPSQQTPPELRSPSGSDLSSRGGDDLST